MVEHFRAHTRHKIGGRAKAMVVTGSRLHAVRYKQAFDKYIAEKGYTDIGCWSPSPARSRTRTSPASTYTEVGHERRHQPRRSCPSASRADEYQVLLVAEKYQTGFDQPLLHTMYVDKRLAGVQAVQTLSRLNRTLPGKEDTFVLDFVNEAEEIRRRSSPTTSRPGRRRRRDPSSSTSCSTSSTAPRSTTHAEVEAFCKRLLHAQGRARRRPTTRKMNAWLDPAVQRFKERSEDEQAPRVEEFRGRLMAFRNLYAFLAGHPLRRQRPRKLYTYVRFLIPKLPQRDRGPRYHFDDEVSLRYYRLQKISEATIPLTAKPEPLDGPTEVGTGEVEDAKVELSALIEIINERFGTTFTEADELFFSQIREEAVADEALQQAATANPLETFKLVFDKALEGLFIDRMEQNESITARFLDDKDFRGAVSRHLMKQVYEQIRGEALASSVPAPGGRRGPMSAAVSRSSARVLPSKPGTRSQTQPATLSSQGSRLVQ